MPWSKLMKPYNLPANRYWAGSTMLFSFSLVLPGLVRAPGSIKFDPVMNLGLTGRIQQPWSIKLDEQWRSNAAGRRRLFWFERKIRALQLNLTEKERDLRGGVGLLRWEQGGGDIDESFVRQMKRSLMNPLTRRRDAVDVDVVVT